MILAIGGIKGGSGKTTLAVNFAAFLSLKNKKVLLVDADAQKSAYKWALMRPDKISENNLTTIQLLDKGVASQVRKLASDYDAVIIDVGGRDTVSLRAAMLVCDIFLTPFRPRSFDIWTIQELELIIQEAMSLNEKIKTYSILNQADPRGVDNGEAIQILKGSNELQPLENVICQRKAFANASSEGMSVFDSLNKCEKSRSEMRKIIENIYT